MRKCKSFVFLMTLCLGARASYGETPEKAAPKEAPGAPSGGSSSPATREEPPAPPRKYLETGARLFNRGRYELAGRYLDAANLYRDRLSEQERTVLDVYREKYEQYLQEMREKAAAAAKPTPPAPADVQVKEAVSIGGSITLDKPNMEARSRDLALPDDRAARPPGSESRSKGQPLKDSSGQETLTLRDTADPKQKARWLLHQGREQIALGHFDEAERFLETARGYDVQWGRFEDNPKKLTDSLAKARARAKSLPNALPQPGLGTDADAPAAALAHDRRNAKALLREARGALSASQADKAEAIVREVRTWDLHYTIFDDTPDRVTAAIQELRRREGARKADLSVRTYPLSQPAPEAAPRDDAAVPASAPSELPPPQ